VIATIVDWSELGQTVAAAAVAGVGVTLIFSLGVFGAAQWLELRRAGRGLVAFGAAALTVVSIAVFAAAIALGIVVMADK
jgi:hypothetical protein